MIINSLIRTTFKHTAVLKTIPEDAINPSERETVGRVACSDVYAPLSGIYAVQKQLRERDNSGTLAQARTCYVSAEHEIQQDMRLEILRDRGESVEYRIRDVTAWPAVNVEYYELLVEAD